MSWGWRKILQMRGILRSHIWKSIGNGRDTSAWMDKWCPECPLRDFITPRQIMRAGFNLDMKLADVLNNGEWGWPHAWYDLYPVLINIESPQIQSNKEDQVIWKDSSGKECRFSASIVWNTIRYKQDDIPWMHNVWFSQCIPRHAFHLWLVFKNKLKTQDRLKAWDVGSATNLNLMCCPLCKTGIDSRSHLFFQCPFSLQVWNLIKVLADMRSIPGTWDAIEKWLTERSKKRTAESVISRLLIAAATYYIWQERNARLFTSDIRNAYLIRDIIVKTVRLKLITFKFKETGRNKHLLEDWKIPHNGIIDND